ncbi:MAG: endonuclease/exonuclease/phosphatase family protein [Acidimicrobiales bacterium]
MILRLAALAALIPLLVVSVWTWRGYSRPSAMLVLEGFQMVVLAPAWVILVVGLVVRDWWIVVPAALVVVSHLRFCLPAIVPDRTPGWVASAPTLTVFCANVRYDNPRKQEIADLVTSMDADVVVLNEMTPELRRVLDAAGVPARYPTVVDSPGDVFGEMLLTRLPASGPRIDVLGASRIPAATVRVGDGPEAVKVHVHGVHVHAPKSAPKRHIWRRNLDGLGAMVEGTDDPVLFVGDFNSAPWHGPFRRLLRRGLADAHDARGRGLTRSWTPTWPALAWLGPVMRIDHALYTPHAFPTAIRDVVVPGSDHRGFLVTFAVEPA